MKKILTILVLIFLICPANIDAASKRWWQVYFTSPEQNLKRSQVELNLVKIIERCNESFYGAFFEIDSYKIANALIKAKKRGIKIALVVDNKYLNEKPLLKIKKAGISVVSDKRRALMHNKFAIIDKTYLWTGSYNLTENGAYKNNNNVILIKSKEVSSVFFNEFKEMYKYKIFGNKKEQTVFPMLNNKYYVKIDKTPINIYFSPDNRIEEIIIKRIMKAKRSIFFMAFSFTSDSIGNAVIKKYKQGLKVAGIFEKRGAKSKYSEYVKMRLEGIPVKLDKNKYTMHHKVFIIDNSLVITGSYNFSKNASKKNDENVIMIKNKKIANKYFDEFKRLYK